MFVQVSNLAEKYNLRGLGLPDSKPQMQDLNPGTISLQIAFL